MGDSSISVKPVMEVSCNHIVVVSDAHEHHSTCCDIFNDSSFDDGVQDFVRECTYS